MNLLLQKQTYIIIIISLLCIYIIDILGIKPY
jgi:hypothetical protein